MKCPNCGSEQHGFLSIQNQHDKNFNCFGCGALYSANDTKDTVVLLENDPIAEFMKGREYLAAKWKPRLGATGEYPDGRKFCKEDQGGLRAGMIVVNGKIVMNFGKSVEFLIMTSEQARAWGKALMMKADELDRTESKN